MTTLPQYRGVNEIFSRLSGVSALRRMLQLVTDIAMAVTVAAGSLVVVCLGAGYWPNQPPTVLRWILLVLLCGAWLGAVAWVVTRILTWRQSKAEAARFVEQAKPELKNNLINSVLLSQDTDQVSPDFVQRAINETVRQVKQMNLNGSISTRTLGRWALAAGAALLLLALFLMFQYEAFVRGLSGTLRPTSYVRHNNKIEMLSVHPGDVTVFAGQSITVIMAVSNDDADELPAEVLIDGRQSKLMMPTDGFSTFTCPLGQIDQGFRYAVRVGESRWPADKPYYTVTVLHRVKVEGLDLQHSYPPYTHLKPKNIINADGTIEAPQGTRTKITVRLDRPVPTMLLEIQGAPATAMKPFPGNKAFEGQVPVDKDGIYRIVFKNAEGRTIQQLPDISQNPDSADNSPPGPDGGYYPIRAIPDAPPKIDFLAPKGDVSVSPGGKLATRVKVFDKYGLTAVKFFAGKEGQRAEEVHPSYALKPGQRSGELDFAFSVAQSQWARGDAVICYATATDNRTLPGIGGPQTTSTPHFRVTIEDAAKAAAEKSKRFDELRKRLLAILKLQEPQRVNSLICLKKHTKLEQITKTGAEIAAAQKQIKAALLHLAANFMFDTEMLLVQRTVAMMGNNEATIAIEQAQILATMATMQQRGQSCRALGQTQDKIIDSLHALLGIMPSLANKAKQKDKAKAGEDLPADAKAKLSELKENLEKFIEEQKKVIKATQDLAKKPVDNFLPEDEQILKDLIKTEDKWEKFMDEAFQDLSKLMEQDFSNPGLLKELASIKSDVTMAKDALAKKAVEIATALEDNGVGGGEEIKMNMEKWLPDKPDREKWVREDLEEQANVEMPELPKELEDLMGDLLEEEEDIFEEMQDATGKFGTSADAGWDAMDGPISSMNADGVTGNQLPNTSEMSGRSGEGRQGKSGGEYVEDKAVGKGGRRTPTRLTPDAYQKGQVDDKSTDPPGGASGGGKLSGAGEEGLEGPAPPPLAKEMGRLAGKQAQLLNKTERIRAQFKANDYANFKAMQAITLMTRVKKDLENYRYNNVLRARDATIAALKQTQLSLSGKVDVEADSSSAMPKYIRDDIADAMKGKLPTEYREVLQQYYRRLSEQGTR